MSGMNAEKVQAKGAADFHAGVIECPYPIDRPEFSTWADRISAWRIHWMQGWNDAADARHAEQMGWMDDQNSMRFGD